MARVVYTAKIPRNVSKNYKGKHPRIRPDRVAHFVYSRKTDPLLARILGNPEHPLKYGDVTGTLDPYSVYLARANELAAASKPGIERFAFNVFGPSLIGSLAFALDPFRDIRFTGAKISSVNRTRKVQAIWPQTRGNVTYFETVTTANGPDLSTPDPLDRGPVAVTVTSSNPITTPTTAQAGYLGFISDTTRRTRSWDSAYGEYEYFCPHVWSPPRRSQYNSFVDSYVFPCVASHNQINLSHKTRYTHDLGPAGVVTSAALDALLASERASALTSISKFGYGLVKQALPAHPSYQLLYNIAELKDVPHMLKSTLSVLKGQLPRNFSQGMRFTGDQYLNLKFGWESTLNAIQKMLVAPQKIAKRINFLIRRKGKPTTYSSVHKWRDKVSSIPAMSYLLHPGDSSITSGTSSVRDIELRVKLNATIDWPNVAVPAIRREFADLLWGKKLTPTDLYNLVPWTWLADWFSGLGDYLTLLDRMNLDPSLINFGFITYVSDGDITYTYHTKGTETYSMSSTGLCGGGSLFRSTVKTSSNTSKLRYRYQIRKDLASISGVKTASSPTTLSPDQLAILGALTSKFAHN